jgi:hypothetical protein
MKPRLLGSTVAPNALFRGSRMFNNQNELNAANSQDALKMIASLLTQMSSGAVVTEADVETADELAATAQDRREMLTAAYKDDDNTAWREIGATIAGKLTEHADREGFMRNLLMRGEVAQGSRPRFEVRVKDARAIKAVGPTQTSLSIVRDKYIETDEFQIKATPYVYTNDLNQGSGDLLDNAYLDALEQIFKTEDETFYTMARAASGSAAANSTIYMSGAFSNLYLGDLVGALQAWGVTASTLLMATDILNDITVQGQFPDNFFDPVTKLEIIQTGRIGSIFGLGLITDAYRHPKMRVLSKGDVFALGAPDQLGGYTDRGPVTSLPLNAANSQGVSGKGWHMEETVSMVMHNSRAVSYAAKL